jgi:predicted extracellular nuclease
MRTDRTSIHRLASVLGAVSLLLGSVAGSASPAWSQATSLFFSEYVEGSGNNKALEIYNCTGAAVDLAADRYRIEMYFNGSPTAQTTIALTGVIANGGVYVVADDNADLGIVPDQVSTASFFNGNDAVALVKDTTVLDVIGQIGADPGAEWGAGNTSTQNNTLRRRPHVSAGDPDGTDPFNPAIEWVGFAQDTFNGLGAHSALCGDLAALIEALRNHTHTYLTGKGAGHNNTEATTGTATIPE